MPLEAAAVRATRATRRPAAAAAAASRDFSASAARETKLKTHQGAAKRWKAVGNGSVGASAGRIAVCAEADLAIVVWDAVQAGEADELGMVGEGQELTFRALQAQAGKQHLNSGFAPSRINALSQTVYSNHTQVGLPSVPGASRA